MPVPKILIARNKCKQSGEALTFREKKLSSTIVHESFQITKRLFVTLMEKQVLLMPKHGYQLPDHYMLSCPTGDTNLFLAKAKSTVDWTVEKFRKEGKRRERGIASSSVFWAGLSYLDIKTRFEIVFWAGLSHLDINNQN